MSDTFDHAMDAYGQHELHDFESQGYPDDGSADFIPDALHYHEQIQFLGLTSEISNAYLIDGRWIPKKICKHLDMDNKTVWVHSEIYENILNMNTVPERNDTPF